jgi:cAMP-specific phosphodiesterase
MYNNSDILPPPRNVSLKQLLEEQRTTLLDSIPGSRSYLTRLQPITQRPASAFATDLPKVTMPERPLSAQGMIATPRTPIEVAVLQPIATEAPAAAAAAEPAPAADAPVPVNPLADATAFLEQLTGPLTIADEAAITRLQAAIERHCPPTMSAGTSGAAYELPSPTLDEGVSTRPPLQPPSPKNRNDNPPVEEKTVTTPRSPLTEDESQPETMAQSEELTVQPIKRRPSAKLLRNLAKLRIVSATPEVYRTMVKNKDNMETIYNFTTRCSSAKLGTSTVLEFIQEDLKKIAAAKTCRIFTLDDTGVWTVSVEQAMSAQSGQFVEGCDETPDLVTAVQTTREVSWASDGGGAALPVTAEDELVAIILFTGVAEATLDMPLLISLLHVSGLFVRNNNSYREAKWQSSQAEVMLELARQLAFNVLDEAVLAASIMTSLRELIDTDQCTLFGVAHDGTVSHFFDEAVSESQLTIAQVAADSGKVVNIADAATDSRFVADDESTNATSSILSIPVTYEEKLVAVAQLTRCKNNVFVPPPFSSRDEHTLSTFSTFIGMCLRNCKVNDKLLMERRKMEAILAVVGELSHCDIRSVNSVVDNVLQGAKSLLNADRATLFLVDKERNELYSTIADDTGGKEIRVPFGVGIAGTVAQDIKAENIRDAYADPRFNKNVDIQFGYVTTSMLTEPITFQDEVIAVAQLVNKKTAKGEVTIFDESDEETFRAFSLFAGISLSNSHLLEFAVRAGHEAMELQAMRDSAGKTRRRSLTQGPSADISDAAVNHILRIDVDQTILDSVTSRNFNLFDIREQIEQCSDVTTKLVIDLFDQCGFLEEFNCPHETMCRFVLACRDKYRNVPYHNFYHAVDVCQTLHTFLYEGGAHVYFSRLDCFVLLVTALVHDLDHMGLNNSFHMKTDSPLGMLSSASGNNSVLEVHHCNLAIEILADPGKNVFDGLEPQDKTRAFRQLIDCVLATDMARHGDVVNEFMSTMPKYDKDDDTHSKVALQMLLKAADVSNVTKPFGLSRKWGQSVTEEFYQQGDKEKAGGVVDVLPMFDRSLNNELAKGQIGFIDFIAMKFFKAVTTHFPGLAWTIENIEGNRAQWNTVLQQRSSFSRRRSVTT